MGVVGDVATQIRGVSYDKSVVRTQPDDGFIPLIRGGNIGEHGLIWSDLQYVPASIVSTAQILRTGDIVLAASSGSLSAVGKAAIFSRETATTFGAFCKALRPNTSVDAGYFGHYFQTSSYRKQISRLAEGANINNLRKEHLDNLAFPMPPLDEQRRIAAILDKADELRTKRRQALAHLDTLTQSIFHSMLDSQELPQWMRVLGEVATVKGGKRLQKGDPYEDKVTEHAYIRVSDMHQGSISTANLKYISPTVHEKISRYTISCDDLMISIAGSIGMTAVIPTKLAGANLTENAAKISPLADASWLPLYMHSVFQTREVQQQIRARIGRVTIGKLALFRIEQLQIPIPPLELQQTFADRVAAVERLKDAHRKHLAELDVLFASLQHRAFKGEL